MHLEKYRFWFYAAAFYNLAWGAFHILFPGAFFEWVGMERPSPLPLWQVLGMFVLVYAPGYWWAARNPEKHAHFIALGLLGKVLGPIGFLWSAGTGQLPWVFGLTILTNDLIWWPSFFLFLKDVAAIRGGWKWLLGDE